MATSKQDPPKRVPDIPSSSPAFGTPLHPINPRRTAPIRAPPLLRQAAKPTVLPIILPPATLRPLAFRTFTKKHDLTLTSTALQALATFIGKHCGSGWREEGLAEKVLEEVAKAWKRGGGQVIVDAEGENLKSILKTLEGSMVGGRIQAPSGVNRQGSFNFTTGNAPERPGLANTLMDHQESFGMSKLEVDDKEDEEELLKDPRDWIQVVGALEQPKLLYNVTQKHFEKSTTKSSILPDPTRKTELFRQRYHLVHQRILRNETFQTPTFSTASGKATSAPNTITPIANLLGRSGTTHLLLGMLAVSPTGTLALSDLTGTIALDLQHARPIPETGAYFAPGMIVLVDGTYEEDYGNSGGGSTTIGNTGGVGGTIGGKFIGFSVGHPPCERRSTTLGGASDEPQSSISGPAFGWTDFLGVGSERATGARMSRLAARLLPAETSHNIVIASDIHLDIPSTFSALRTLLQTYSPSSTNPDPNYPLALILMGNFNSRAALAGAYSAASLDYKEHFDALAAVLSEFPHLLAHTSLVFVPGDNDAFASAFSGGAAAPLPRKGVPSIFTTRVRRAVADANREVWGPGKANGKKEGEVIWTTNPSRLCWFGVKGEMVLLRDDVRARLHRTAIRFGKPEGDQGEIPNEDVTASMTDAAGDVDAHSMDVDSDAESLFVNGGEQQPRQQRQHGLDTDTEIARSITRTLLSQSYLSPFPLSVRPLHWDLGHALNIYPLPTAVLLSDKDAPAFVVKYCGCTVMNPGPIDESGGKGRREGRARWIEFDIGKGTGVVRAEG